MRIDFVRPGSHPPRLLSGGDAADGVRCFLDDAGSMMVRATCALIELVAGVASDSVDSVIIVYDQASGGQTVFTGHDVDALLVGLHRGFCVHRVRPDFRCSDCSQVLPAFAIFVHGSFRLGPCRQNTSLLLEAKMWTL